MGRTGTFFFLPLLYEFTGCDMKAFNDRFGRYVDSCASDALLFVRRAVLGVATVLEWIITEYKALDVERVNGQQSMG